MQELQARANLTCELCGAPDALEAFPVAPHSDRDADHNVLICATCRDQLTGSTEVEPNHWRCLGDSMWSEVSAVKVVAWRMLQRLDDQDWARGFLDMIYMEDTELAWAEAGQAEGAPSAVKHMDSNGSLLETGDTVTLIKDLDVKGAGFTAKRGTAVRNIMVVDDNAEHIEGRVNGTRIVILTKFVRKAK
ncbi:MAG: PhnA domain-containing protein [Planctomycetota bacterium]|nr:PhnA domain-containing protein [Planctomycetota bacterium]MDG2142421.1 PhnA domain-containing protein [Planctomycetota bacterium]